MAGTLLADPLQPFVWVSTPAGHLPARNAAGTMRFYAELDITDEQQVDFALERTGDDAAHAMLLLADPQTKTRTETDLLHETTVPSVLDTVHGLGDTPVFGLTCGDIMYDDLTLYPEYERAVSRLGIPFYQVIGNHDLEFAAQTTEAAAATFNAYFGPTWYSFDRGAVHYVVLDDVFWHGEGTSATSAIGSWRGSRPTCSRSSPVPRWSYCCTFLRSAASADVSDRVTPVPPTRS